MMHFSNQKINYKPQSATKWWKESGEQQQLGLNFNLSYQSLLVFGKSYLAIIGFMADQQPVNNLVKERWLLWWMDLFL